MKRAWASVGYASIIEHMMDAGDEFSAQRHYRQITCPSYIPSVSSDLPPPLPPLNHSQIPPLPHSIHLSIAPRLPFPHYTHRTPFHHQTHDLKQGIRRRHRRVLGISIVGRRHFYDIGGDEVDAFQSSDDGAEFASCPAARFGGACCRCDYKTMWLAWVRHKRNN